MNSLTTSVFDLPGHLARKADPALIGGDERHFAAIAESLDRSVAELSGRLEAARKAPGGIGQEAMDRDIEIHKLTARLRALGRFGLDLCLGRIVREGSPEPVYVGRLGLADREGRRLLVDWRSPAAGPFFGDARPPDGRSCWILDGDLGPYDTALEARLRAADTIVVLDFTFLRCAWRTLRRGREQAEYWRWVRAYRRRSLPDVMRAISSQAPHAKLYVLRNPAMAQRFANEVRHTAAQERRGG